MVVFCLLLEVQINQEAAQVSGSPQANTGIVCSGSKCLSLPECFLVVSTMKTFICVLSVWFSTLANCSAPTKQGIEEKCCSRKCRLLMPFTFHYRANATTSRLQRFLNCAALAAVWRKTNGPMHSNFKDGCQTSKASERYQNGIFEVPHSN